MHFATLCEMTAPTDKNCGNESQIRTTFKNSPFSVNFLTPYIFEQKAREFKPFSDYFAVPNKIDEKYDYGASTFS